MNQTVSFLPAFVDIEYYQGDDFAYPLQIEEDGVLVNLSTRTFSAQIRHPSTAAVIKTFSEGDGVMTIDTETKQLYAAGATLEAISPGAYVYDIQVSVGGVKRTYQAGKFITIKDVTRP